jgi:membrane protein
MDDMASPERFQRIRSLIAWGEARYNDVRGWVERTIFWRIWERLLENEFVDRSVALAAKAFVSFFPALVVVAAFAPSSVRESIVSTLAHRLGLSADGLQTVKSSFASSTDVRRATGILGLLLTFFYVNSFTTALRRVFARAWRRPPAGAISGYAIGAMWLLGIAAYFALLGGFRRVLSSGAETVGFGVVALAASIGLWWLTAWVMLHRQVRWRPLFATAVIIAVSLSAYAISANVWMTRVVESNQKQFGYFGVTLALVTWLSGAGTIILVGACAGPVLAEDKGILGRLLRGDNDDLLMPGAKPSLPPPLRTLTFSDALGHRDEDDST